MEKRIISFIVMGLFILNFASAWQSDTFIKDNQKIEQLKTNTNYGKYIIKETSWYDPLGIWTEEKTKEVTLKNNSDSCMGECYSIKEIQNLKEGSLIDDVRFYRIYEDGSQELSNIRSYQFSYWGTINDYETQCNIVGQSKNGTDIQECDQVKVGSHEGWINYNLGDVMPVGNYTVKLIGQKRPSWSYDWQVLLGETDIWTSEWAVWGGRFSGSEYQLSISATGIDEAGLEINGVIVTQLGNNLYKINTTNADDNISRALIFKTLFFGTDGSDPRATSQYINATGVYSRNSRDNNLNFHLIKWEVRQPNDSPPANSAWSLGNFTDTSNNYVETWSNVYRSAGDLGTARTSYILNGTELNAYSGGASESVEIGTDTAADFIENPIDNRLQASLGNTDDGVNFRWRVIIGLSNGSIDWSQTLESGYTTIETFTDTDFNINESFPVITFTEAQVTLNSPADNYISPTPEVQFNCSAEITGGATLVNMSLWTNESGSWEIKNTTTELETEEENLVSYYAFDEQDTTGSGTIIDSFGNNDLTNNGADNTTGKIKTAYDFVASSTDYMVAGSEINLGQDYTVSFWTYIDNLSASRYLISNGEWDGADYSSLIIGVETTGDVLYQTDLSGVYNQYIRFSAGIGTGSWYHILVTKSSGNRPNVYVNNVSLSYTTERSSDWSTAIQYDNDHPFVVGAYYKTVGGYSLPHDGKIDEVGLWNRTLNSTEILYLYNSGAGQRPSPTSSTQTWNRTITDSTLWSCQACDSDGDCGFATENRTVLLDISMPIITVESPIGTLNYNYIEGLETLNVTFNDSSLDSCWYNYNGTNITIDGCLTGVKNSTTFILEEGNYNMTIYANDSVGNENSTFIEWNYLIFQNNLTYNAEVLDLSIEDFILYVTASEEITDSKLNYNGTDYSSSILFLGSGLYKISNSFQIPDTDANTNFTFFFNITTTTGTVITNSYNQSVIILLIDNCASYTNELFNISLYDEKTLLDLLGTVEVNLELFNNDKITALTTAVSNFYNMSNMAICSNANLTDTGYYYDLELRYYVDPTNTSTFLYVPEFYHIQKAQTANFSQTLNLYNLNINQSTEFTMFYRDDNYVARQNVLLQIERKYISEGIFRTVEIPITSSEGSAVGHFDLNNYKYKIIATYNGEILNVFDNPAIACESELAGICILTLNGQGSPNPFEDYNTIKDISYSISLNDTEITINYVIPSGETKHINVYMFQVSSFRDDLILCNQSLTSSAGSFTCNANSTIGDSSVFIEIRVDGVLESRNRVYYQEDLAGYFLLNNYAIASLFLILLVTMMVSSPMIMVATSIFSVALLGFVFLLKGSSIGLVLGSFSWLVVAGILILLKLNKKDET